MIPEAAMRLYRAGEGTTYRLPGLTLTFKHDGAADPCQYSLCMATSEPRWRGARLHRHNYEEWHIQLEGTGLCQLGDDTFTLAPGDMVYIAPAQPHGFQPSETAGRQLLVSAPPGLFEGFIAAAVALEADAPTPDRARIFQSICEKYGIEFLGPPWS
jgi:mannose-6-phosphate isomerase-like protein (cupin superfamily)